MFGVINALIKPIVKVLSFPISAMTLGLFGFVINGGLLLLIAWVADRVDKVDVHDRRLPDAAAVDRGLRRRDRRGARAERHLDRCRARRPRLGRRSWTRCGRRRCGSARPLYVTSVEALASAAAELRDAFPDPWLRAYSVKANDVPAVVARLAAARARRERRVVGRVGSRSAAGLPNERVTLEGIGKTDADLRAAVRAAAAGDPLRWVAVESP